MPWILRVKEEFSAAHYLPDYDGKCEVLHGHNYAVEVFVGAETLGKGGMAYDFAEIRARLKEVMPDHRLLNDLMEKPSAENIAKYIYEKLLPFYPGLIKVVVWESDRQGAEYQG
ncbi:MAG: 6-carboxytetrahydropterin synthase QueD [candidate division WOR-3 bacterium]